MVFMPPRHSKSEIVSVNFPSWVFGTDPNAHIMEASYNASLATDFGRQVRNIMESPEYAVLFDTRLAEDSKSKSTFGVTNGRGAYNAMGVGGSATGKGAKFLIIDDPHKNREEAESEVISESVWNWYKSVARTRLTPDGRQILVMTRWNDRDLAARILKEEGHLWDVVNFPAIADEDEEYRKEGEALWADHFTLDNLLETKNAIGAYDWASLYQQNPISRETQKFKQEMFKYIEMKDVMEKKTNCYITIDSSLGKDTKTRKSDWTGITINWIDTEGYYNFKAYKTKIESPQLIELIFDLWQAYKPVAIGLEETAFTQAIQPFLTMEMATRNVFPNVVPLKHGGTAKNLRIEGMLPRYQRGYVRHIVGMCVDLEEQLLRFPVSDYDDVMDAAAYQDQIAKKPDHNDNDDYTQEEEDALFADIGV